LARLVDLTSLLVLAVDNSSENPLVIPANFFENQPRELRIRTRQPEKCWCAAMSWPNCWATWTVTRPAAEAVETAGRISACITADATPLIE
jgi:hypothetical protein